jgi:prevent-host-death family protein
MGSPLTAEHDHGAVARPEAAKAAAPTERPAITTVGIRALARNVSGVVAEVARSGRPALVTRHGEPVAAVVPIAPDDLLLGGVSQHLERLGGAEPGDGRARTEALAEQLGRLAEALRREG